MIGLAERFARYVEPEPMSGCHLWSGGSTKTGYGCLNIGSRKDGSRKVLLAHRTAFELFRGPIPKGAYILHRCDNPACVNPDHLFIGTAQDNMLDMAQRQRGRKSTLGLPRGVRCQRGRFHGVVQLRGKRYLTGYFSNVEDAITAEATLRQAICAKEGA